MDPQGIRSATGRLARSLTGSMLEHGLELLAECGAAALLVPIGAMRESGWTPEAERDPRLIHVGLAEEDVRRFQELGLPVVRVPPVLLTRIGQVRLAMVLAVSRGLLRQGDRVVALAGPPGNPRSADMIVVLEVDTEFERFLDPASGNASRPEVLARLLELALELGSEGREGKPVGTLFVVGDHERVLPLTRQLILNPFHGYPEARRNVLDHDLEETIKELATIDGAFVIRGDGVVLSGGTYVKTSALPDEGVPSGLGARHQAAAGISLVTDCVTIAVSESTGTVTVFRRGKIITEIEKPQRMRREPS